MKSPRVRKISPLKKKETTPRETLMKDHETKEKKMANRLKFNIFEKMIKTNIVEKES